MQVADRQRANPYLERITEPLYEQWYLLHHRMVRIVTNRLTLAEQVRSFLYYAELLVENRYEYASELPVEIPIDLLWQVGQRLYKPIALTCYLFEPRADEPFPPAPAEVRPDDATWEEISGVEGPKRARWGYETVRFREYQAFPDVSSRICSVLDKADLHSTIFVQDVSQTKAWFLMRFVFYMVLGAMLGYDGYEVIHTAAIAYQGVGALIAGSPGSGKSTLVLSCLNAGMHHLGDDVVFLGRDDDVVHVYGFPEDIGIRTGTLDLLGHHEFVQRRMIDKRQKQYVPIQAYFRGQVITSCPVRLLLFLSSRRRGETFQADLISPAQAVSRLMEKYMSQQQATEEESRDTFDLFSDMVERAVSYNLWLTPDTVENAEQVRRLLERHRA